MMEQEEKANKAFFRDKIDHYIAINASNGFKSLPLTANYESKIR